MSEEREDDTPPGEAFPWGLTPGGVEPVEPVEPVPPAYEPPVVQPPVYEPLPTEAFPSFPSFPPLDPAIEGVHEALSPQPVGLPEPVDEDLEASAIESLFGEQAFVEYEEAALIPAPPRREATAQPGQDLVRVPAGPKAARAPIPRTQKILMGVAGGLAAALALVALFVLGTRLSGLFPPPVIAASASPSPSPSASGGPVATGPVAPGLYAWSLLAGGECLEPFDTAWQDAYTVVPCAQPHAGQLVYRGTFDDPSGSAYPGIEELQSRVNLLCTATSIIDYAVAGTVLDLQVTASYAVDATEWDDGNLDYFCFVDRAGSEPLTASIAVPPAPAS